MISLRETRYDPVHDAQRHFRSALDSMAHPGKICNMDCGELEPPAGLDRAAAAIALALLNRDVSFRAHGYAETVVEYLRQNTRCPIAASDHAADYLFFAREAIDLAALAACNTGQATYPETGATVLIQASALAPEGLDQALTILLQGPGVDGTARLQLRGVSSAVLTILREKNEEYPLGVDAIFTCESRLVSVPRSSRLRWE